MESIVKRFSLMGIHALYGRYIASLQENSGVIQSLKLSKDSPRIFVLPESEFYLEGKSDKFFHEQFVHPCLSPGSIRVSLCGGSDCTFCTTCGIGLCTNRNPSIATKPIKSSY